MLHQLLNANYMPHGHCYFWNPWVLWLNVLSDGLIAASYFSIPGGLYYFVRRRKDLAFPWMFVLFAIFIFACGTTHLFEIWNVWRADYVAAGLVKLVTGVASVLTALLLWSLIPKALDLPSRAEVENANRLLVAENAERVKAEETVRRLNAELEERVRAANVLLRTIIEETADAVFVKDLEGRFLLANPTTARVYGRKSSEELLGRTDEEFVPPAAAKRLKEVDAKVMGSGESVMVEEVVPVDGSERTFLSTKDPYRDPSGKIVGMIGVARDITDRKEVEAEREELLRREKEAREAAEHASRMKDEFLSTLSHELRTPLNAIVGWTTLLMKGPRSEEKLAKGLETIQRSVQAQSKLIDDLLDMGRIVSGKLQLELGEVDIASILQLSVETARSAAEAKQLTLVFPPPPPDVALKLLGDAARLQQVFWNLLSNAVKFTPRGGVVTISIEDLISHLVIKVSDTGLGISAEFLPYVFERFRQADASTTRKFGGLGIGLSIVKHLVEAHGGTVEAASAGEGRGSVFTVRLPLAPAEAPLIGSPTAASGGDEVEAICATDLAEVRALVVDDEVDARELVRTVLEEAGAEVETAGAAAEGLRLLQGGHFDVLVSDIGMPTTDGYAFIRQVRALPGSEGGAIPAVALTAFARAEDRRLALLAGFQMHIAKPAEPMELIAIVKSLAKLTTKR